MKQNFKKLLTTRLFDAIIRVTTTRSGGGSTNLKEVRESAGKSQEDIAIEVGLSRAGYANIEAGKRRPSVPVAKKIAAVLNLNWTLFYDEADGGENSA